MDQSSAHSATYYTNLAPNTIQLSWSAVASTLAILLFTIHRVLVFSGLPIPSLHKICWKFLVSSMPSKLVLGLGAYASAFESNTTEESNPLNTDAGKSNILRNVFSISSAAPSQSLLQKDDTETPPGLGNWDNSCYQNSVLQALSSVRGLRSFLQELEDITEFITDDSTFAALEVLLRNLNNGKNCGTYLWTPSKLKSMSSWQQQDAQEYFSKIMESMEKDIAAAFKNQSNAGDGTDLSLISSLVTENNSAKTYQPEIPKGQIGSSPSSQQDLEQQQTLSNPMDGLLAQRVGCTRCGFVEGLSLIPFNCITLPLGRGYSDEIGRCLDEYTHLEVIEGVDCAKCTLLEARRKAISNLVSIKSPSKDDRIEVEAESLKHNEQNLLSAKPDDRLAVINAALEDEDFTESTLKNKCGIAGSEYVSSTKTRQAIILKAPSCLVLHINRSLFDEHTGAQVKNYAELEFEKDLDLGPWCMPKTGPTGDLADEVEKWEMDPCRSMLHSEDALVNPFKYTYELRSIITHQGRHENGHYICYRKVLDKTSELQKDKKEHTEPLEVTPNLVSNRQEHERWWRFSDENVYKVEEDEVLSQAGAFMLFYERVPSSQYRADHLQATGCLNNIDVAQDNEGEVQESDEIQGASKQESVIFDDIYTPKSLDESCTPVFAETSKLNRTEPHEWAFPHSFDMSPDTGNRKGSLPHIMKTSGFDPEDSSERQRSLLTSTQMIAIT